MRDKYIFDTHNFLSWKSIYPPDVDRSNENTVKDRKRKEKEDKKFFHEKS